MNLEDLVCSLPLAKYLNDFGIKQESLFYWTTGGVAYRGDMPFFIETNYSAFTSSELGELLPKEKPLQSATESIHRLFCTKSNDYWSIGYLNSDNGSLWPMGIDTNEANARAILLIYLIGEGMLKI